MKGEALGDELAPPLDSSAEAVARRKLYAAMLSKSALDGEPMAIPFADLSAEEQSKVRLEQASLTTTGNASGAVSADRGGRPFRRDHHLFGCDDHRQQLVFLCDRGTLRRVTSTEEWNLWQKLIS